MTGKKRTRNGEIKPPSASPPPVDETATVDFAPPYAQPSLPSSTSKDKASTQAASTAPNPTSTSSNPPPSKPRSGPPKSRQKLPRLPSNATVSKRPLLHPAIPTPFAASSAPKALYITATTPYIPSIKRIRKLLSEITRRAKQSQTAHEKRPRRRPEANGRLAAKDVEREIAEEVAGGGRKNSGGEAVYLKATGRAIPRALELGVHFQGEEDCWVRVEMGSVRAVDDVEVQGDGDEDVPETRTRMLSSVTVSVGLK